MRPIFFAAITLLYGLVGCGEGPGGMPSTYHPRDLDPRLTKKAASAASIVTAVERFRATHGSFPPDLKAFQGDLPTGTVVHQDMADDWRYSRSEEGSGFQLVTKLGWDPSLIYDATTTSSTWTFDPGDGSETKELKLYPWASTPPN